MPAKWIGISVQEEPSLYERAAFGLKSDLQMQVMKETTNPDTRLLRQIKLTNLLSFGPNTPALELESLNILIGPNGSGKSNLMEALALMRATPIPPQTTSDSDVRGVVRLGGGVSEWIWKGARQEPASIEVIVNSPVGRPSSPSRWIRKPPLRHLFAFRSGEHVFRVHDEVVENDRPYGRESEAYSYFRFNDGKPILTEVGGEKRTPQAASFHFDRSILAQRRDPELYPEITYLADTYEKWRIYREWVFGRDTDLREPQKADMRNDRLEEDFYNLGLFLSRLRKTPRTKKAIVQGLIDLYDGLTDFEVVVEGGSVQVFFVEGDFSIPANRLSDGTLRYLCLLAILCDPEPPPLICIEEPELGLHPDIIPKLADLLLAASKRTQIIVTTHSDILVDAMTEHPESVVVCEKHDGRTQMRRLKKEDLAIWLDKYRLGQLWTKGQIGGTRW